MSTPTPTLLALPSIPKTIVSPFSFILCVGGGKGKLPMSAEQGPSAAVLDIDMVVDAACCEHAASALSRCRSDFLQTRVKDQ